MTPLVHRPFLAGLGSYAPLSNQIVLYNLLEVCMKHRELPRKLSKETRKMGAGEGFDHGVCVCVRSLTAPFQLMLRYIPHQALDSHPASNFVVLLAHTKLLSFKGLYACRGEDDGSADRVFGLGPPHVDATMVSMMHSRSEQPSIRASVSTHLSGKVRQSCLESERSIREPVGFGTVSAHHMHTLSWVGPSIIHGWRRGRDYPLFIS